MGLFDGFPFKSRDQEEREKKDFERRVFPFGIEEQKAAALGVLRQVVSPKMKDHEVLFTFISAKDRYTLAEMTEEGLLDARKRMKKLNWVKGRDLELILALVPLDTATESLEDYPTAEQVLAAAAPRLVD